jgi:hypothetical protein
MTLALAEIFKHSIVMTYADNKLQVQADCSASGGS